MRGVWTIASLYNVQHVQGVITNECIRLFEMEIALRHFQDVLPTFPHHTVR
jgi:hypothetical protein